MPQHIGERGVENDAHERDAVFKEHSRSIDIKAGTLANVFESFSCVFYNEVDIF